MKKTKEIDVWVQREILDDKEARVRKVRPTYCHGEGREVELSKDHFVKAKLIIELPERKCEITESQFDEAWDLYIKEAMNYSSGTLSAFKCLKEKLFGGGKVLRIRIWLHSLLGHEFCFYEYWHKMDDFNQTQRKAIQCSCGKVLWQSPTGEI